MINRIISFFRRLTEGDSKESSKRFMALFAMILASYVVIRFANEKNSEFILAELLSFILMISGVSSWQNIRQKSIEKSVKNENISEKS
tara:strand:+ start:1230 stop:1493 length:264 start_codon:yes stop_codon:yes gene_type:complete